MGRDPNQNRTPDLFSTGAGVSTDRASEQLPRPPSRRPALPKDLPKAIQYLSDGELDWLLRTAMGQAKRRKARAYGDRRSRKAGARPETD